MDYFEAVQEGRARTQNAVNLLQDAAGPCYPMLFLKAGSGNWTPVGEEILYAVVPGKEGTAAVVICDAEGNSKAMTTWVQPNVADGYARALASKGLAKYDGEVNLPI